MLYRFTYPSRPSPLTPHNQTPDQERTQSKMKTKPDEWLAAPSPYSAYVHGYTEGQHSGLKLAIDLARINAEYALSDEVREAMIRLADSLSESDAINRRILGLEEEAQDEQEQEEAE